jgi:hypothetical protein
MAHDHAVAKHPVIKLEFEGENWPQRKVLKSCQTFRAQDFLQGQRGTIRAQMKNGRVFLVEIVFPRNFSPLT